MAKAAAKKSGAGTSAGRGAASRTRAGTRAAAPGKRTKKTSRTTARAKRGGSRYERLVKTLRQDFHVAKEAVSSEVERALEVVRHKLEDGSITDPGKVKKIERELEDGLEKLRERLSAARARARGVAEGVREDPRYKNAADVTLSGLHGLAASLRGIAERLEDGLDERRPHTTGEVVVGGRYDCRGCGKSLILTHRGELPACAGCGGRRFRLAS